MLKWNGNLMETCKNYFKIMEFKVMGHLKCSLVNKTTKEIKIKQAVLKKPSPLNWLDQFKNAFSLITVHCQ